jgi:hypothetical protein
MDFACSLNSLFHAAATTRVRLLAVQFLLEIRVAAEVAINDITQVLRQRIAMSATSWHIDARE